jgi:16S rRNA (guanine527-N7)-methyltransferase
MESIDFKNYFPSISNQELEILNKLEPFYKEWNEKINLISRKDMDSFMLHHVLHSLTLAKFMKFREGTEILDVGTGGGFPGIPLAILFPDVKFHLIDGTGKKILVVNEAINYFKLENVKADHIRIEQLDTKYDFITARAVTELGELMRITRKFIKSKQINARPNGLIAYKGFPLRDEAKAVKTRAHEIFKLSDHFKEDYFKEKCIVYVPMY